MGKYTIATALSALLLLSSCASTVKNSSEEPSFTPKSDTQSTVNSASSATRSLSSPTPSLTHFPDQSPAHSSQGSVTQTPTSDKRGKSGSSTHSSSTAAQSISQGQLEKLRQADGSYLLTTKEPSRGEVEDVVFSPGAVENAGFSDVTVRVSGPQKKFLLWTLKYTNVGPEISWSMKNLDGEEIAYIDNCTVDLKIIDEEGQVVSRGDAGEGELLRCDSTEKAKMSSDKVTPGIKTLEITINNPGYDNLIIRQPIVFDYV